MMPGRTYRREAERREEIIATARCLIEEHGVAGMTMSSVACNMGVSRGTVYRYFEDKDSLVDAVLDDYIADLTESLEIWEINREKGNPRDSLRSWIELGRRLAFENSALRQNLTENENAGFYIRYSARAINQLVGKVKETTVEYYRRHYEIEIDHIDASFYVLIAGFLSYLRANPDADVDMLVEVAAQMLHIPLD